MATHQTQASSKQPKKKRSLKKSPNRKNVSDQNVTIEHIEESDSIPPQMESQDTSSNTDSSQLYNDLFNKLQNVIDGTPDLINTLAVKFVEAAIDSCPDALFASSLSDLLKDDPRVQEDDELASFISELENPDNTSPADDNNELNPEDLANAFDAILADFDDDV